MKRDFICTFCGNEWSQEPDDDDLYNGRGVPQCPICETNGCDPNDYGDFVCEYCHHEWRNYGNGGLVFGCIPRCPECGL